MTTPEDARQRVQQLAHAYATRQTTEVDALVAAIRELEPRFAFDRAGRPGAVAAVRQALPAMERELLDAIVEDYACELAALREAIDQVAGAVRRAVSE